MWLGCMPLKLKLKSFFAGYTAAVVIHYTIIDSTFFFMINNDNVPSK